MKILCTLFCWTGMVAAQPATDEGKSVLKDLKDSIQIHKLLVAQQKQQIKLDEIAKRFANRHNCPTSEATINSLGFLICKPQEKK